MDLYGELDRINNAPDRVRGRRARRRQRQEIVHARISEAIPVGRTAKLRWSLQRRDPTNASSTEIGNRHPGVAGALAVRAALKEFRFPQPYDLRYIDMNRKRGSGGYQMDEGEILMELTLRSLSGAQHKIDIPVQVRNGRVEEPVVLIHQGIERTITQPTFDSILKSGEFVEEIPERRNLFSPPPEERRVPRRVPIVRPGMFGVSPVNRSLIAAAVKGRWQHDAQVEGPEPALSFSSQEEADAYLRSQGLEGSHTVVPAGMTWQVIPSSGEAQFDLFENAPPFQTELPLGGPGSEHEGMGGASFPVTGQVELVPPRDEPETGPLCVECGEPVIEVGDEVWGHEDPELDLEHHAIPDERPDDYGGIETYGEPVQRKLTRFLGKPPLREAERRAMYELDEAPEHLQVAERPRPPVCRGDRVKTTMDLDIATRDGQRWHVPKGSAGLVMDDHCGSGHHFVVRFDELGFDVYVPGDALK